MFRIVSFNLLFGAKSPRDRLSKIIKVLEALRADIIFLQECVDWRAEQLQALGDQLGLPYTFLTQSNPRRRGWCYNLGALSRSKFLQNLSHAPSVLAHACQQVKVEGFEATIYNTHFTASSEQERIREVAWFLGSPRPGILVGDLNSLNPIDPYTEDILHNLLSSGVTKYGSPISFEVMSSLGAAGWSAPLPEPNGRKDGYHWVSRWRTESEPAIPTRTDYILTHPEAQSSMKSLWIVDLKNQESDHNPVIADFES